MRPRGSFLLATIMAEAGVSVTVGSLGVRQRGGSGSRGADVGALGARAKEARLFFHPGTALQVSGWKAAAARSKARERRAGPLSSGEDVAAELQR